MSEEVFRPVPGLDELEVNTDGTIVKRNGEFKFIRFRRASASNKRYKVVYVGYKAYPVHQLVYRAFIGPIKRRITFKDNNCMNCYYKNLLPQKPYIPENTELKKVFGWPELLINNDGSIIVQFGYEIPIGKIQGKSGVYYRACLRNFSNEAIDEYVSVLVAKAFLSTKSKDVIVHLDGNTQNNHFKNLQYATHSELYKCNGGKHMLLLKERHENRLNSAITKDQIPLIIKKLQKGQTLKSIAKEYDISDMSIHRIKKRYLTTEEVNQINKEFKRSVPNSVDLKTQQIVSRLLRSGSHTVKVIAEMCCISTATVYKIDKKIKNHTLKI